MDPGCAPNQSCRGPGGGCGPSTLSITNASGHGSASATIGGQHSEA